MLATIESVFRVRPAVFWERLFFDADYNAGLYRELGRRGVPLVIGSARLSARSVERYRRVRALIRTA